jgi:hypothetical protein
MNMKRKAKTGPQIDPYDDSKLINDPQIGQNYKRLKPYLLPLDSLAQDHFKACLECLKDGSLSSGDDFFKTDLKTAERDDVDYQIRKIALDPYFSNRVTEVQKEILIKHNLLDFDWLHDNRLSFEDLSSNLQFKYFPENWDKTKFNLDIEYFRTDFRNLFREKGDDVRVGDIFDQVERNLLISAAKSSPACKENMAAIGIDGLIIESIVHNKKKELTARGHIALIIWLKLHGSYTAPKFSTDEPVNDSKIWEMLIREIPGFKEFYDPPNSYSRLIHKYYDLFIGPIRFRPSHMKEYRELFRELHSLPDFDIDNCNYHHEDHEGFKSELIRQGLIDDEDAKKIESYYYKSLHREFDEITKNAHNFVFLFAQVFCRDYPNEYKYYISIIKRVLKDLQTIHIKVDDLNRDDFICTDKKREKSTLDFSLNLKCRDFKFSLDNNMILYCIFYDFIFDGFARLKRALPANRPPKHDYLNTMLVYLVNCLSGQDVRKILSFTGFGFSHHRDKGATLSTPFNITRKYIFGLTGFRIANMPERYKNYRGIDTSEIGDLVRPEF